MNASEEFLGQRDDDARRASHVAESVLVLVLGHLADEFGAVGAQASALIRSGFSRTRHTPKILMIGYDCQRWKRDGFIKRLRDEEIDVRVRVYLCRDERRVIPFGFKSHCLIVIGGRHAWWPTTAERWRQRLETAGHFVLFVDSSDASTRQPLNAKQAASRRQEASRWIRSGM